MDFDLEDGLGVSFMGGPIEDDAAIILALMTRLSTAISLKRIADNLEAITVAMAKGNTLQPWKIH